MKLAVLLMHRVDVPAPLIGDLLEGRREHSAAWFWRQTLVAIVVALTASIRVDRVRFLRAFVLAWLLNRGIASLRWPAMTLLEGWTGPLDRWLTTRGVVFLPASFLAVEFVGAVLTGWLVARLHRGQGLAASAVYVASLLLLYAGGFVNSFGQGLWRFGVFGLFLNLLFPFVVIPAAVLGGALKGAGARRIAAH